MSYARLQQNSSCQSPVFPAGSFLSHWITLLPCIKLTSLCVSFSLASYIHPLAYISPLYFMHKIKSNLLIQLHNKTPNQELINLGLSSCCILYFSTNTILPCQYSSEHHCKNNFCSLSVCSCHLSLWVPPLAAFSLLCKDIVCPCAVIFFLTLRRWFLFPICPWLSSLLLPLNLRQILFLSYHIFLHGNTWSFKQHVLKRV